jgi:histidinol-phosphatase (PHP family)
LIVDYHMHLRDPAGDIDYTVEAVERFVDVAAARGVDEIGFTEHVYYFTSTRDFWRPQYLAERCAYDLDVYVDAVLEAKRQGLPVKLGLEVDYVGGGERQDELAAILDPYPWDYLLGSVHWLGEAPVAVDMEPGIWAKASVDEVWAQYLAALAELAGSGHVDVLAHPDLAKIFGRRPAKIDYPALDGVALEISTAGLHKPVGEIYPDVEMLAAHPPITLASDAHEPANVGRDFDRALEYARAAGYDTVTVFEGRRGRQEPLG